MRNLKKKIIITALIAVIVFLLLVWIWWGNTALEVNNFKIEGNIPQSFDGFRIAQVSDLHNAEFGKNNKKLIDKLKATNADIIVMTGDMIDSRNTKTDVAINFAKEAVKIAPCYYVTGNHEARIRKDYEVFKKGLIEAGVNVMENKACEIVAGNDKITLIGLNDTGFDFSTRIDYLLSDAMPDDDNYKILLAHRPEYFEMYEGVDLVFSGHAHGGQIRLPFIGGLFAPGQGFLPEYDSGVYTDGGTTMVVSRGVGNSLFPVRVNNKPEIVVVELQKGR